jgi:hypothetical protein
MGRFADLLGTVLSGFKLGLTGPQIKNESGTVAARNNADDAYATIRAALAEIYGNDIELNAGAAESSADWVMTLRRPSTGMTKNLTVVFPGGEPSNGQGLYVSSYDSGSGTITLGYVTLAAGDEKIVCEGTALAFGSSSPVAMFTKPDGGVILKATIIVDTAFDGTPTVSIGISGNTSKFMAASHSDLTAAAGTSFEVSPNQPAGSGTEDLIATYSAGGATAGAARILVYYAIPA